MTVEFGYIIKYLDYFRTFMLYLLLVGLLAVFGKLMLHLGDGLLDIDELRFLLCFSPVGLLLIDTPLPGTHKWLPYISLIRKPELNGSFFNSKFDNEVPILGFSFIFSLKCKLGSSIFLE